MAYILLFLVYSTGGAFGFTGKVDRPLAEWRSIASCSDEILSFKFRYTYEAPASGEGFFCAAQKAGFKVVRATELTRDGYQYLLIQIKNRVGGSVIAALKFHKNRRGGGEKMLSEIAWISDKEIRQQERPTRKGYLFANFLLGKGDYDLSSIGIDFEGHPIKDWSPQSMIKMEPGQPGFSYGWEPATEKCEDITLKESPFTHFVHDGTQPVFAPKGGSVNWACEMEQQGHQVIHYHQDFGVTSAVAEIRLASADRIMVHVKSYYPSSLVVIRGSGGKAVYLTDRRSDARSSMLALLGKAEFDFGKVGVKLGVDRPDLPSAFVVKSLIAKEAQEYARKSADDISPIVGLSPGNGEINEFACEKSGDNVARCSFRLRTVVQVGGGLAVRGNPYFGDIELMKSSGKWRLTDANDVGRFTFYNSKPYSAHSGGRNPGCAGADFMGTGVQAALGC